MFLCLVGMGMHPVVCVPPSNLASGGTASGNPPFWRLLRLLARRFLSWTFSKLGRCSVRWGPAAARALTCSPPPPACREGQEEPRYHSPKKIPSTATPMPVPAPWSPTEPVHLALPLPLPLGGV